MALNSSEGDTTETVETSTVPVSLSVGEKRKAETINSEDSGESEGGAESEEGSDNEDYIENMLKWENDSYEGRQYHSSEQDEYSDKEYEQQWRYFRRQVIETKGFFKLSDKFPDDRIGGFASVEDLEGPAGSYGTIREFCTLMVSVCINKYKEEKKKNLKLDHIVRVNFKAGGWSKYYITFAAKESESSNAPLVEYQAKTVLFRDTIYPILCRPSPSTKEV